MSSAYKWVPIINEDYCTGCGSCVRACTHGCLKMIWDCAKLERPEVCDSGEVCAAACPQQLIRMDWLRMTGNQAVGRWRESLPETEVVRAPSRFSLGRLFRLWA